MGINIMKVNKDIKDNYKKVHDSFKEEKPSELISDEFASMYIGYATGTTYDVPSSIGSSLSDASQAL